MNIPTMAVKITEKTYPFAVACLHPGFAVEPKEETYGSYLVINELRAKKVKGKEILALVNVQLHEETFFAMYKFVTGELKTQFAEVKRVNVV